MGFVQNMSFFHCPNCDTKTNIFGTDGCLKKAQDLGLEILANIPLHQDLCITSDQGKPIVISQPSSFHSEVFMKLGQTVLHKLSL